MEKFTRLTPENKTSGIDRILGLDPEDEVDIKKYFSELCKRESLEVFAKEPSLEFKEIFPSINSCLREFLEGYGIRPLDVSLSQIVFLDKEKLSEGQRLYFEKRKTNAFYHSRSQKIVLFKDWNGNSKLAVLHALVHEMVHMQAFEAWQKIPREQEDERDFIVSKGDRSIRLDLRRLGFRMVDKDREITYFHDLDEAITTELTMRFDWQYLERFPELSEEIKERRGVILAYAKRNNSSFEQERRHVAEIEHEQLENGIKKVKINGYSYDQEREKFLMLLDGIYKNSSERFASPENVFKEFATAALTGNVLTIARVIEGVYGKGSFRYLGEKTADKRSSDTE
ncbi:MAG: hypothetical protein HGB18_02275 [Candidatus Moranbacteria bacterium]|nr:hypothetical protein [Candidatus Moranbacteria bacterium]